MSQFLPLLQLSFAHEFYLDQRCHGLSCVASDATQRLINNLGLLCTPTADGLRIDYETSKTEAIALYANDEEDPLRFEFKVYSQLPEFKSITSPYDGDADACVYLTNQGLKESKSPLVILHSEEYVSNINRVALDAPSVKGLLSQKDRLTPPVCVVQLYGQAGPSGFLDSQSKPVARQYQVRFKARDTVWKYFVLGAITDRDLHIHDLNETVEFQRCDDELMSDQRKAAVFRSTGPLPLREQYDLHFQLREKGHGADKTIVQRLPVARLGQVANEVVAGHGIVVSEIYINH